MTTMNIIKNPTVSWATHPADQGSIDMIEGLQKPYDVLPTEGQIITKPFLVDPKTKQTIPVRVVEIQRRRDNQGDQFAVVVTRADRDH